MRPRCGVFLFSLSPFLPRYARSSQGALQKKKNTTPLAFCISLSKVLKILCEKKKKARMNRTFGGEAIVCNDRQLPENASRVRC